MYLIPGTVHVVTWSKQNLLDNATYYVQAVIRDTRSGEILSTMNLVDLGNGRFSRNWNIVQDPTGQGREIEIEKTIYEDAGYTQVSPMYGRWLDQYIIYDIKRSGQGGGGNGGSNIDYSIIAEIITRAIAKGVEGMKPEPVDFKEVLGEIDGVKKTLGERLREVLKLGSRVQDVDNLQKTINTNAQYFIATAKEMSGQIKEMQKMMSGVDPIFNGLVEKLTTNLNEVAESFELKLKEKTDGELTYVVKKFTDVMNVTAEKLTKEVTNSISTELSKPIRVQAIQEMNAVREKDKKPADDRVKKLIGI